MFAGRLARSIIVAVLLAGSVAFVADRITRNAQRADAATPPPTIVIPVNAALFGFKTKTLTIRKGRNVRVINNDRTTHTVTSNKHNAANKPLFNLTSPAHSTKILNTSTLAPGTYKFHCRIHPNMTGVLIVKGKAGGVTGSTSQSFNTQLRIPRVLTGSHIYLPIRRTQVQVFAKGPATWMWTYGGSYPAPTIRRTAEQDTKVTVTDHLPGSDGKFTVHLHGDHHRSKDDGRPNDHLISAGHSVTYDYPLTDGHAPERAGYFYYHDHRMGFTGRNNWMGMQGMFIVDNPGAEHRLGLPTGSYDVPIIVSDRSFNSKNQLVSLPHAGAMVTTGPSAPPNDATVGTRILVNGTYAPHFEVATHKYRLRLLNASNFQSYDFKLSDGRAFTQIGTGDSLLPHRLTRKDILLGPSQRADVIVNFGGELHKNVVLKSVPRVNRPAKGIGTPTASLMQFRVTRFTRDASRVPYTLRQPPKLPAPSTVTQAHRFTWTIGVVHKTTGSYWTINGHMFDPTVSDHTVKLGSTELWTLYNNTNVTHYFHLHEEQWQTIKRDGKPPAPWERGLQDTWKLDPGEKVVVEARFSDYTGEFMLHCHMLDHEDHGLMAQFDVVK